MEFFTHIHSHNAPPYQLICTQLLAVDNATDTDRKSAFSTNQRHYLLPLALKLMKTLPLLLKLRVHVSVSAVTLLQRTKQCFHPGCTDLIQLYSTYSHTALQAPAKSVGLILLVSLSSSSLSRPTVGTYTSSLLAVSSTLASSESFHVTETPA